MRKQFLRFFDKLRKERYNVFNMSQEIKFQERSAVSIDGISHPISFVDSFHPNGEYIIDSYIFTDELGSQSDGCVFRINPMGSTRVMRITDPNFSCQRITTEGKGWFLGVSPDGVVVCYELDASNKENPLYELSAGWVDCWIAADDGLEVADVSTPPFDPKVEREITLDDPSLPPEFWQKYRQLKQIE